MFLEFNQLVVFQFLPRLVKLKNIYGTFRAFYSCTMEPQFNEPLYNEILSITNEFPGPSDSKIYGKEPRYNETSL